MSTTQDNATEDSQRVIAELRQERDAALAREAALAEMLEVINRSSGDTGPVFEAILKKAHSLCGADMGAMLTYDGEHVRAVATHGYPEQYRAQVRRPFGLTKYHRALVGGERLVHVADVRAEDFEGDEQVIRAFFEFTKLRTFLMVPIRKDETLLGLITAFRTEVHPFTDNEIALIEGFATQAIIAMENARLITEQREALEQQTATAEVLQVINASPGNLTPVFDAMLDNAMHLCGAAFGELVTFDGERFKHVAVHGVPAAYAEFRRTNPHPPGVKGSIPARLREGEDCIHITDLMADDIYRGGNRSRRAMVDLGGARTLCSVTLRKDDTLLGYITIYRQEVRPFSNRQIALLQNFAAQAVIAMENARLLTEQQEALEQQTATAEVLQVINKSPGNLAPVFDTILEKAMRLCGAAFGSMYTYDGERFHSAAQRGVPAAYADFRTRNPPKPVPHSGLALGLETGRAVHILDLMADAGYLAGEPVPRAMCDLGGIRTLLVVPLCKDDSVLGMITIYRQEVRAFSDKQIALLENFAAQAVIAMENARLLGELQERTAALAQRNSEYGERIVQQTATIEVLEAISTSTGDDQPVLELIARRARELCGAETTGVFTFDGEIISVRCVDSVDMQSLEPYLRTFPCAPARDYLIGRAILERQVVEIDDADAAPGLAAVVHAHRNRSMISLPFLVSDRVVGGMSIGVRKPGGLTDLQKALARILAEQASIAISAAATVRQLQDRTAALTQSVAELRALEEVMRSVNSSLELETVLSTIISRAVHLSDADEGTIYEFDDAEQVFVPKSAYGMTTERVTALRDRRIRIGETPLGNSAAIRAPLHIPDLTQTSDEAGAPELVEAGIHALLAVPLLRDNRVVGGLVIRRRTAGGFAPTIPTLLQTFAGQSVLAIENARLFQELTARGEEARRARAAAEDALTDLRRTQDRLVQTEKMASLGQLTAGIAHEIKNPLNFVNNFSDLSVDLLNELNAAVAPGKLAVADGLRAEIDDITTTLKGNLEKIAEHGRRADSIVKNMLLHSRTGPSEHRAIDLNTTVEEALNLAYHGARAETPGFNITMEKDLDPKAGTVDLYPQEFIRVMLNLIGNGFYAARNRANQPADPDYEPTLRLTTRDLGELVEIRVRDNGTGISDAARDKIFEPFFTTKPSGEGTGLGLSLSYDIVVKQHGGRLTVDSQIDAFTEFTITLPRRMTTIEGGTR